MGAHLDSTALRSAERATKARLVAEEAAEERLRTHLIFLRDARAAGWSWARMGRTLGVSESALRRDWEKHRQRIGRLGNA